MRYIPKKNMELFNLGMAVSALTLEPGQGRTSEDIAAYLNAAGYKISRQAVHALETRALRKLRLHSSLGAFCAEWFKMSAQRERLTARARYTGQKPAE
jgi:hypothetical protein